MQNRRYPIFTLAGSAAAQNTVPHEGGITKGSGTETETDKKIWRDADVRAIVSNYTNREIAAKIDALTRLILNVERFSILGDYTLESNDNETHEALLDMIETWLDDELELLSAYRASFNAVKIHGTAHFHKLYEGSAPELRERGTAKNKKIRGLQQLIGMEKHINPFDSTDYYYFQEKNVETDWKNPNDETVEKKRVWYIKDGEEGKGNYPNIVETDRVINRDLIFEIRNDESGESAISACLNEIFIKNLIMLNLPNLIMLVVAPGIALKWATRETDGKARVPEYPSEQTKNANLELYNEQLADYEVFQTNMQTLINNVTDNWYQKGIMAYPDNLTAEVMESENALNPQMLETIMTLLNTEIAFALGFPLALLTSSGTELATARNISETMAGVLRGIQDQYERITNKLILEQFPEAKAAGIRFVLSPLTPRDAREQAEVAKLYSAVLKTFADAGASIDDLKLLARKYEFLEEPEFGGEVKQPQGVSSSSSSIKPYTPEQIEAAMRVVDHIVAMQDAINIFPPEASVSAE